MSGLDVLGSIAIDSTISLSHDIIQELHGEALWNHQQSTVHAGASLSKEVKPEKDRHASSGGSVLDEFCCDPNSMLGEIVKESGVQVVRLCRERIDLSLEAIERLCDQVASTPGCAIHRSLECRPWSQWPRLNRKKHPRLCEAIDADQKACEGMLQSLLRVADLVPDQGDVASFEWPRFCSGWNSPILLEWVLRRQISWMCGRGRCQRRPSETMAVRDFPKETC